MKRGAAMRLDFAHFSLREHEIDEQRCLKSEQREQPSVMGRPAGSRDRRLNAQKARPLVLPFSRVLGRRTLLTAANRPALRGA
jgi:hypothetical protein